MPTHTPAQVDKAIRQIRRFHQVGRESLERHPERVPYRGMDAEARRCRLTRPWMTMARVFADRERGYSESQLERLCRECEKYGTALGRTHIARLLSVPWPRRRDIQRRLVGESWSVRRLEHEIRRILGPRASGGRRPRLGEDATSAYAELMRVCIRWERVVHQLEQDRRNGLYDVDGQIRRIARELLESTEKLKLKAEKKLASERNNG